MKYSQNGWPVVSTSAVVDKAILGVEFPNGWLKGDVDVIFTDLIVHLNKIEPIVKGWCWGYHVKNIEGSNTISNHASATAFDYNAPAHPMGKRNTYSPSKRAAIRELLKRYDGVIRWGGDYTGRPDDMHFEIHGTKAAVAKVADKFRAKKGHKLLSLDGYALPELKFGMDDEDYDGYNSVIRLQQLVNAEEDGNYGPDTAAKVKAKVGYGDGKTVGIKEWAIIAGLSKQ